MQYVDVVYNTLAKLKMWFLNLTAVALVNDWSTYVTSVSV